MADPLQLKHTEAGGGEVVSTLFIISELWFADIEQTVTERHRAKNREQEIRLVEVLSVLLLFLLRETIIW